MAALGEVLKSDDDAVVLHALEAIVEHGAEAVPLLNEALKRPETTYLACTAIEQMAPMPRERYLRLPNCWARRVTRIC